MSATIPTDDRLFVLAGSRRQAEHFALDRRVRLDRLVVVKGHQEFANVPGAGKTLWIVGTAEQRTNYPDLCAFAKSKGFRLRPEQE
jgi:hypothetical protein